MTDWDKRSTGDSTRDSIHDSIQRDINERIRSRREHFASHGIIWGVIVCIVGVVLLLDHMGYVSADRLWRLWPLLVILAAFAMGQFLFFDRRVHYQ